MFHLLTEPENISLVDSKHVYTTLILRKTSLVTVPENTATLPLSLYIGHFDEFSNFISSNA